MTTTTKRPTDAELAALLRDVAGYLYPDDGVTPDTLKPSLLAAADALESAPTFEERVERAADAIAPDVLPRFWGDDAPAANRQHLRHIAAAVLRAADGEGR